MKVNFPNISIENENKKVYAIDLSGGGQEPFTLKLNYVASKTEDFNLNTDQSIGVSIGNFFNFRGYPISFSKKQSVSSGTTCELTLVDTSIILDKLWVGLQGKHGGKGPPPVRRLVNTANTIVPQRINLHSLYTTRTVDQIVTDITIYNGIGNFNDLILVGSYIDPCGDAPNDTVEDGCNPCSAAEIANIDCAKSRLFEILDVDYSFSELVLAMAAKKVNFKNTLSSPNGYRAQYTGSLREVLNSWCQDFGWAFYWEDEGINLVNLSQGIDISNLALENSINCKIEEYSESKSIEGVKKNINIAYFGKAGEVKNYTCNPGGSSGSGGSGGSGGTASSDEEDHIANVVTLEMLWKGNGIDNVALQTLYGSLGILKALMAASRLSPELRRILVYYKKYGFKAPGSPGGGVVTTGIKKLLGWDIKAIVSSNPSSDQLTDGYDIATIRSLYTLLSQDTSLFDKKFLDSEFKQNNYYFLIIKPFSDGGTQFEKLLCEKFTGNFYIGKPGQIKTRKFTSDFGEVISSAPDLNISHFLIKGSQEIKAIHENAGKNTVTVKVPVVWPSDLEDSDVESFLMKWNKKIRNLGSTSFGSIQLQEGHEIWMIRGNGPEESEYSDIDLSVPTPATQVGYVSTTITLTGGEAGSSGSGANQSQGPTILLMPKIEIVKEYVTNVTSGFTSIQVNYQNITNNSLSNVKKGVRSCFVDEAKILTYADGLMKGLNTNFSTEKITKNYSILGLPDTLYKFTDGLTSFSIRLDQSGTRTSLSFSNLFPSEISDSLKKNQLNYLIKNSSNNKYINNTFK